MFSLMLQRSEISKMGERWRPSADFEDEMMSIQPDCDLIFPEHEHNPVSLAASEFKDEYPDLFKEEGPRMPAEKSKELLIVGKIREKMRGRKVVGRLLTEEDLEDDVEREAETIAMIRGSGSAPCHDFPLKSKNTLPTICSRDSYKVTANGHLPLLLDAEFFKLKPKNSSFDLSTSKSGDETSSSNDTSNLSLQFRTFTLFDNEESITQSDNADAGSKLSRLPSVPKNTVARKLKEQSRAEQNGTKADTKNKDSMKIRIGQKNYMTPKELYMKIRGNKS